MGLVAAPFTALMFASGQLAGKIAVSELTEGTVVLLRSLIALVFLTALCALRSRETFKIALRVLPQSPAWR